MTDSLDEALRLAGEATAKGRAALGRPARQRRRRPARARPPRHHPRRPDRPDLGPRRAQRLRAERAALRRGPPAAAGRPGRLHPPFLRRPWPPTSRPCSSSSKRGARAFDYGNNIRGQAQKAGVRDAFDIPGFVPEYIRPLFCDGKGPFRWAALSGKPSDIYATDEAVLREFPEDEALARWIRKARSRSSSRGCRRASAGSATASGPASGRSSTTSSARGEISAPIVIGRDHLDTGSVASPEPRDRGDDATGPTRSPTGPSSTPSSTP